MGELGVEALRAVKERLDPAGIMNPGKLLPLGPRVVGGRRVVALPGVGWGAGVVVPPGVVRCRSAAAPA